MENKKDEEEIVKATFGSDLQADDLMERSEDNAISAEQEAADEAALVAGVSFIGKISIWLSHINKFFIKIWENKKYRYASFAVIALFFILIFTIPTSRNGVFNSLGFRSNADVLILDAETSQPIANVNVTAHNVTVKTNEQGVAELEDVRLGSSEIIVDKDGYAEFRSPIYIGFGTNEISDVMLTPTGNKFDFTITDWLSDEAVEGATISFGDSSAKTDVDGFTTLVIAPTDAEQIDVTIEAEGYLRLDATIDTTIKATNEAVLVAGPRHYFVSNRSGQFDIYQSNLDGTEQKLIAAGTGFESDDLRFSISPDNRFAALVSTRTGQRDANGRLFKSLYVANLEAGELEQLELSEDIQLVNWIDNKVIYVIIGSGESAFSARRHQLYSYDTETKKTIELEASNHFNDVKVVNDQVYYAADDSLNQEQPKPFLYRISADGTGKKALIERQSWTIFQGAYEQLIVNTTKNGWFELGVTDDSVRELAGQPSRLEDRRYEDSPNGKLSAWIDERDGKGVLVLRNNTSENEEVIHEAGGLQAPLRWIGDDRIIFRVSNSNETADYLIDIDGGEPQKIVDVANVESATRWFYY